MSESGTVAKTGRFPCGIGAILMIGIGMSTMLSACASSHVSPANIKAAISQHRQTITDSIAGHPTANPRPAVAVLDLASDDAELGIFATEEIIMQLVRTRKFRVVDRDSIETLLKEHDFQYSGAVSDETMVSIGKFIGASVIITGQIFQDQRRFELSLKILDVETAEIIDLISIPIR